VRAQLGCRGVIAESGDQLDGTARAGCGDGLIAALPAG
jgi:hypothetical protein